VRRRLEPRAPAHAARGQQRDPLLAEEPGRGLGRVARVRVVREQHAEPAPELLVERREQQRQRRLRDAGARGQRRGEGGQAVVGAQPGDERVQQRAVLEDHDDRPERPLRGRPS
jgi:hypothetical protein